MYYRIAYKDIYGNDNHGFPYLSKNKYKDLRIAKGVKTKFEKRGLQEVTIFELSRPIFRWNEELFNYVAPWKDVKELEIKDKMED